MSLLLPCLSDVLMTNEYFFSYAFQKVSMILFWHLAKLYRLLSSWRQGEVYSHPHIAAVEKA